MARSWDIERGMAAVAERAATPMPTLERAEAVLAALRTVVPYDCAALSFWDPVLACYRPVANVEYPEHLYAAIHTPAYREEHVRLGMAFHGVPLRFRDLQGGGAATRVAVELAWPAGLREGLGMALFAPDRRPVGFLSMSTVTARYPTDRQRLAVGALGGALGAVADAAGELAARVRAPCAVALPRSGPALPLPGAAVRSPLLADGAEPLELARQLIGLVAGECSFLWRAGPRDEWQRIELRPCDPAALPGYALVVSAAPAPAARDLTARELEVLTLIARGLSNGAIAERLVVAPRTVSTHVEHVLEKLGVATRAEAAARAVGDRLLVWVGREPPLLAPIA